MVKTFRKHDEQAQNVFFCVRCRPVYTLPFTVVKTFSCVSYVYVSITLSNDAHKTFLAYSGRTNFQKKHAKTFVDRLDNFSLLHLAMSTLKIMFDYVQFSYRLYKLYN